MEVTAFIKNKLKLLIQERTGISLGDMNDAERLSAELARKKLNLSPHTIARLFGILKQERKHYRNTYDVIARFLDFQNWSQLFFF